MTFQDSSVVQNARNTIINLMLEYAKSSIFIGGSDSLLIATEDLITMPEFGKQGSQAVDTLILKMIEYVQDNYLGKRKLSVDREINKKLLAYALLFSGSNYIINISDDGTMTKELYTLSENTIKDMYNNNLLVGRDITDDASIKASNIIMNIRTGRKFLKTLIKDRNYLTGIYTVRLDKAYHIEEDMRMHYIPMSPTGTINLDNSVIIPFEVYSAISVLLDNISRNDVLAFKEGNKVSLATKDLKTMSLLYGSSRSFELINKVNYRTDKIIFPEFGASRFSNGMRWYYLENLDKVSVVSKNDVSLMLQYLTVNIFNTPQNISLLNVDTRGAKSFLKELVFYDNLADDKKRDIDWYTDDNAYRWLLKNKKLEGFKPYSIKFGNLNKRIDIPSDIDEMRKILREGIYEVTLLTRSGEYKIICTSNQKIIEEIYGEDYRIYCNAFSSRIREFYNKLVYAVRINNDSVVNKLINRDMQVKFGISPSMLNLETLGVTPEKLIKALELCLTTIKDSTQNSMQLLVTCLTDIKPKEGAGRNLTRSFYLDNVVKLVKLR